ncbi:unnamed protein product [Spirodela intermedia]|uniref:RRM domain-containing protein n=1 Tax=Spirodela intermedia TaxID=51605 RepID=A0A7I8IU60_SPIIN|nr:unnamed protein product [Spirodela intermedia]CAA6660668.1 unnamed protein product [Spirodela intermedia]
MDPGRYMLQQGWDNNSALEGYSAIHEPDFRVDGSYSGRRILDEGFSRDPVYPRSGYNRDVLSRDPYPAPPHVPELWHQERRNLEEDYGTIRDSRRDADSYHEIDSLAGRGHDEFSNDDYEHLNRVPHQSRENSRDRESEFSRYNYDSDYDRAKRDNSWRRRDTRERDSRDSREREPSPRRRRERSRSRGHDDRSRSRSPRGRSHSRSHREDSYDDTRYARSDRKRERDRDDRRHNDSTSVAPSATVVVKGLSQKTTEEDLYQILTEWGPLRHVRIIKERNSGVSRGFAFIDFPSVPGCVPSDWMCTICGCINFARRTSCNEARTDDAPPADVSSSNLTPIGKKGEAGPTHVLVVRGLDENADEEMLRYEFSKHAPIKDLRLVRDKFTHVSRGFAFVHFHSVGDATKALEATNGTTLERNGQILRVAYAKSIHGPGSATSGAPHSSSLAAAAIEAAAFSQQYDAIGWAPKEYNPDEKQPTAGNQQNGTAEGQNTGSAPQSGFVWDETTGYYYDASSGFYYDGNTGLYYDGNNGTWYSYDQKTQQYVPCNDQNESKAATENAKASDGSNSRKVVISAPAATISSSEKASLPDAVQAAAAAALAAEKKEKEKLKEIKLASKGSIMANKKKMNNVLMMWKQRNHEGQTARIIVDDNEPSSGIDDRQPASARNKPKADVASSGLGNYSNTPVAGTIPKAPMDTQVKPVPVSNSSGGALMGVIRGSGRGVVKSDTVFSGQEGVGGASTSAPSSDLKSTAELSSGNSVRPSAATTFRTDASALGSYAPPASSAGGKRRFSEMPAQAAPYRDRAAERRSLYGSSSSSAGDDSSHVDREFPYRKGSSSDIGTMPFPPGVGRGSADSASDAPSYEVITADRAIDESNVGNRMLRNMGWQEGSRHHGARPGAVDGCQSGSRDPQKKPVNPQLEVHPGDSYRTLIQKKAIARFREMS